MKHNYRIRSEKEFAADIAIFKTARGRAVVAIRKTSNENKPVKDEELNKELF